MYDKYCVLFKYNPERAGRELKFMKIHGLNKTTLLDYPGHVAATVFFGYCNFRCPFCHNGGLVLEPDSQPEIPEEEVLSFLAKRKGILTGVCITGGEPTLEPGLKDFAGRVKALGYLIKLDTNGYRPDVIKELVDEGLIDYIAMDIKNSMEKYAWTAGMNNSNMDTLKIERSIKYIMECGIDYEFRTTVVKEFHTVKDMDAIGQKIQGAKACFLQGYEETEQVICKGLHAHSKEEMERMAEAVRPYVSEVALRGIE